jgi:cytochrome bd ubiquinol oxidase subunit I
VDVESLSRFQFALTIMFHYLFPPLSIGLGWMMVIMEGRYLKTGDRLYLSIARFLTGIFAVVFAMGVATGIVMEFQFGTNWSTYSRLVGDIFGPLLAAEGIFAFFLESGFLAVVVFGWDRVSKKMHFFSTVMVAVGALFSSVWITVANSWQQTPAGYHMVESNGRMRAELVSFWDAIFNPSTVDRLLHVWIAAGLLGAFFILSISAYYLLKNRHVEAAKKMFSLGLVTGLIFALLAPMSGHFQAKTVAETQPAKLAAFEGHFESTEGGAPLYIWGFPMQKEERVALGIAIPGMLSFLVHDNFTTPVPALDQFPKEDWPPVALSFYSYHIMVGLGMYFIGVTLLGMFLWWRGTLFQHRWLLWVYVFSVIGPYVANELGWAAAEVGRQPWIVYGVLRTADAFSPSVSAGQVLGSIIMFSFIYALLFIVWIFLMNRKIHRGPEMLAHDDAHEVGFMEAAAELSARSGDSMTSARDE